MDGGHGALPMSTGMCVARRHHAPPSRAIFSAATRRRGRRRALTVRERPASANPAQALSKRIHYGMFVAESKFRTLEAKYTALIQAQDGDGLMAAITDPAVEAKVGTKMAVDMRACMLHARVLTALQTIVCMSSPGGAWAWPTPSTAPAPLPSRRLPETSCSAVVPACPTPTKPTPLGQVIERVQRKAAIFGQDVAAAGDVAASGDAEQTHKVPPKVVAQLYKDWIMPLTKVVEVEYLLHRLDGAPSADGR